MSCRLAVAGICSHPAYRCLWSQAVAAFMVLAVLAAPALASRELLAPSSGITDADILNFALNLEVTTRIRCLVCVCQNGGTHRARARLCPVLQYLEAEFYSWAAFGKGLDSSLTGGGPASIGGEKANLSPAAQAYANEIAQDEINHVAFLRSALGAAAVPRPLINIGECTLMACCSFPCTSCRTPSANHLLLLLQALPLPPPLMLP